MLRIASATVLVVHALIHLIGFVVPWQLAMIDGFPFRTTILGGAIEVGTAGARLVGVLWLAIAVGFGVAAYGVWRGERWGRPLTALLAVASIIVCLFGMPEAATGIIANGGILAIVASLAVRRRAALGA